MALTNAERQKRYRDRRNGLARAALAEPVQLDEAGDYPFVALIQNHWEIGARRLVDQCSTDRTSAAERQVAAEIPGKRPSAVDLLDIAEKAGEDWAGKRLVALLTAEMQMRAPEPSSPPAPRSKRKPLRNGRTRA